MRKLKILVLVHLDLVPPADIDYKQLPDTYDRDSLDWITEYDVISGLKKLKHDVQVLGVYSDLKTLRNTLDEFKPHIVFNLLEEFDGEALFDQNVVSYLELLRVPYTGCNPRGLILARDKALAKKIFSFHRIPSPKFQIFSKNKKKKLRKELQYPLIVKCLIHEASLGISSASIVHNEEKLLERVSYLERKYQSDAIVEEFIEGTEYYLAIWGNERLKTFPVWELCFENIENSEKEIYSENAKWNNNYRKRKGITTKKANLPEELEVKISNIGKRVYKSLNISGYARIDFRVTKEGKIYVLEANPNPNMAIDDDFATSIANTKINYSQLLKKIISLGLNN